MPNKYTIHTVGSFYQRKVAETDWSTFRKLLKLLGQFR